MACIKQLDQDPVESGDADTEKALQQHGEEFVKLIKKYPNLLKPSFNKGEPAHGVYHKIETGSHTPCKTKRRPIVRDSAKAEAGKAAWDQMIKDGLVERVKAGTNTDWSSAFHLVP